MNSLTAKENLNFLEIRRLLRHQNRLPKDTCTMKGKEMLEAFSVSCSFQEFILVFILYDRFLIHQFHFRSRGDWGPFQNNFDGGRCAAPTLEEIVSKARERKRKRDEDISTGRRTNRNYVILERRETGRGKTYLVQKPGQKREEASWIPYSSLGRHKQLANEFDSRIDLASGSNDQHSVECSPDSAVRTLNVRFHSFWLLFF